MLNAIGGLVVYGVYMFGLSQIYDKVFDMKDERDYEKWLKKQAEKEEKRNKERA